MGHARNQDILRLAQNSAYASLFGGFQLTATYGSEILISNRRAKALLAMLCLAHDEIIDRDYLSKLFWPGRFEAQAKASLRQCLLDLGKLLAPFELSILNVTRGQISLNATSIQTDLSDLETAFARAQYSDAADQLISIGMKPLLDQMDFGDAFNAWLTKHRLEVERRLRSAVGNALSALEKDGDVAVHTKLLGAWTARDVSAQNSMAVGVKGGKTRIAVLPFQSLDAQNGHDYFADGVVDELITTLGQVPQLLIAGRTSCFHFRHSGLSPAQIAAELGVSHLIEGSVQREGERVRIHVHLIAGETGFEIWGTRFDGTLDDVFALQEGVARAITAAIGNALGVAMQQPLVQGLTTSKKAYDLYLQGRALNARLFGDGVLMRAAELLEQAVAFDPNFAEAWVLLGDVHQRMGIYLLNTDQTETSATMADCVRKAMVIKPNLGMAYGLLSLHQFTQNNIVGCLDLALYVPVSRAA